MMPVLKLLTLTDHLYSFSLTKSTATITVRPKELRLNTNRITEQRAFRKVELRTERNLSSEKQLRKFIIWGSLVFK